MKRIDEIFDLSPGNDLEFCYLNPNEDGIAFVSRTAKNNGISGKVEKIKNIEPFKSGTISVSLGGSVLEAFVHEEEYYTGYHIKVLTPKKPMTLEEMQFYCYCIRMNKYKYSFGRQANKTIASLMIPSREEIPEWVYKERKIGIEDIPDYFLDEGYEKACWYLDNIKQKVFEEKYNGKVENSNPIINVDQWHSFEISEVFEKIDRGKRQKAVDRISGDIPYYSASKNNNGLTDYISNPSFIASNALIYTTFGDAYYVEGEFTASDEITYFNDKNLNKYNGLFIATILKQEQFRYSFGRKAFKNKISSSRILLPSIIVNGKHKPDWNYMTEFIKKINYSKAI